MNDLFDAKYLREQGINQAKEHADSVFQDWSDRAFEFLKEFISLSEYPFMAEDVRTSADCNIPEPPSKRAWGAVILKAAREGIIRRVGYRETQNPAAHRTPATLWEAVR